MFYLWLMYEKGRIFSKKTHPLWNIEGLRNAGAVAFVFLLKCLICQENKDCPYPPASSEFEADRALSSGWAPFIRKRGPRLDIGAP